MERKQRFTIITCILNCTRALGIYDNCGLLGWLYRGHAHTPRHIPSTQSSFHNQQFKGPRCLADGNSVWHIKCPVGRLPLKKSATPDSTVAYTGQLSFCGTTSQSAALPIPAHQKKWGCYQQWSTKAVPAWTCHRPQWQTAATWEGCLSSTVITE